MSDLLEFLDRYHVSYTQEGSHARSGWVQILDPPCPGCQSSRGHLGIRLDCSRAACYKCSGKHVPTLLRELTDAPWKEIQALTRAGIFVPREDDPTVGTYTPPTCLQKLSESPKHSKYLQARGLDPAYCETIWGMQATGIWSNYPMRVHIPITKQKRAVSWTARAVAGQEPRYQTAQKHEKSFDEKKWLFGLDFVKRAAIIVEGPFGAVNLGAGTVATLGLAVTQAQISLIANIWRRVICFDNEPAAQRRAESLAESLAVFPGETLVVNLDAADPGEASKAEVELIRKLAFGRA